MVVFDGTAGPAYRPSFLGDLWLSVPVRSGAAQVDLSMQVGDLPALAPQKRAPPKLFDSRSICFGVVWLHPREKVGRECVDTSSSIAASLTDLSLAVAVWRLPFFA